MIIPRAARRASANARNTPFGNCARYASNSAGFWLFMIDCQNRFSCSAMAGDDGGWAVAAAGDRSRTRNVGCPTVDRRSAATDALFR